MTFWLKKKSCNIKVEEIKVNKTMSGGVCPNTGYNAIQGMKPNGNHMSKNEKRCHFQMPLHYPRYKRSDYETMPEWRLDCLLREYGLPVTGDAEEKRKFAMGAFLWPSQNE